MASSNVTTVLNHFPTANEGFITTLGSTVLSGAATVPLTSTSGLTNGKIFVGIIEPGTVGKEQTFTGVVDTGGNQITGVKWTRGSNTGHNAGVTIVDYVSGTGQNMMTKGLLVEHDQDGTHAAVTATSLNVSGTSTLGAVTATSLTLSGTATAEGWSPLGATPNTITANGNNSYDLVFNSTDLTDTLTNGMRFRTTRTVAAPTYMGGLFNGTSHYFTKTTCTSTLSTITNNFTISAFVEPTAYAVGFIAGRFDSSYNNGLGLYQEATGQISIVVNNGGSANYRKITSYQSVSLSKKTYVTASWAGGTVVMYFDGISVPVAAAVTGGTAPTVAGTGGDFSIGRPGAYNAFYFTGYISGVGVFDAVLSAATIASYNSRALTGAETNCIGAWSLNNTAVNQQAAGTNDLTATGGVGYSNRSPFGNYGVSSTLDYGIVMANTFSTNTTVTVQVPEGCQIPTTGGVSSVDYSTQNVPYGFPRSKSRWVLISAAMSLPTVTITSSTSSTAYPSVSIYATAPIGEWGLSFMGWIESTTGTLVTNYGVFGGLYNVTTAKLIGPTLRTQIGASTNYSGLAGTISTSIAATTQTKFTLAVGSNWSGSGSWYSGTAGSVTGPTPAFILELTNAYL